MVCLKKHSKTVRILSMLIVVLQLAIMIHILYYYSHRTLSPTDYSSANLIKTPHTLAVNEEEDDEEEKENVEVDEERLEVFTPLQTRPDNHHQFAIKRRNTLIYRASQNYLSFKINKAKLCSNRQQQLLIVVVSTFTKRGFDLRQAIRQTWLSAVNSNRVRHIFFVGIQKFALFNSMKLWDQLLQEEKVNRDLVVLQFHDTYRNLSLKTLLLMNWAMIYCPKVKFILKSDDDAYWNVTALLRRVETSFSAKTNIIIGNLQRNAIVHRDSNDKFYTTREEFVDDVFPDYVSGGPGYLIGIRAAAKLLRAAEGRSLFWLEDVFVTGILANASGVEVVHEGAINYHQTVPLSSFCYTDRVIASHRMKPFDLYVLWKNLNPSLISSSALEYLKDFGDVSYSKKYAVYSDSDNYICSNAY